jgi:hypothetical protein
VKLNEVKRILEAWELPTLFGLEDGKGSDDLEV